MLTVSEKQDKFKFDNPTYFKEYYATNSVWTTCECGQQIKSFSIPKHVKSKKHGLLMDLKQND